MVRSIDATAAGSRGSETEINSQPRICEVSASVTSHAWPGQVGTRSRSPMARPPASVVAAAAIVTSNSGPAGRAAVGARLAEHEDEPGVREPGEDPEDRPRGRVAPVGALLERARDQHDPGEDDRQRGEQAARRPLAQQRPREQRHRHDLEVREHGREAGADVADRAMPAEEVQPEEHPGGERETPVAPGPRAEAPVLAPGEPRQQRQGVEAAEERRRRGRRVRQPHEDARERDRQRARDGDRPRPGGEAVQPGARASDGGWPAGAATGRSGARSGAAPGAAARPTAARRSAARRRPRRRPRSRSRWDRGR